LLSFPHSFIVAALRLITAEGAGAAPFGFQLMDRYHALALLAVSVYEFIKS
jgi:hypothetical protein